MQSVVANPLSTENIRNVALSLRQSLGMDSEGYFPIVEFIELILPKLIPDFEFIVLTEEEMGNCHGLTCPEEKRICIREDVYNNAIYGVGRDRFTMAHELGHYLLHGQQNISMARTGKGNQIPAYKNPEWQADTFAAELLMSFNLISPSDTALKISKEFGVSVQAAKVRLNKLFN